VEFIKACPVEAPILQGKGGEKGSIIIGLKGEGTKNILAEDIVIHGFQREKEETSLGRKGMGKRKIFQISGQEGEGTLAITGLLFTRGRGSLTVPREIRCIKSPWREGGRGRTCSGRVGTNLLRERGESSSASEKEKRKSLRKRKNKPAIQSLSPSHDKKGKEGWFSRKGSQLPLHLVGGKEERRRATYMRSAVTSRKMRKKKKSSVTAKGGKKRKNRNCTEMGEQT